MITTLDNGTKVVQCGYGSVGVTVKMLGKTVAVTANELDRKVAIGDPVVCNNEDQVILSFCNVNSIDAWIDKLETAKAMLMR